MVDFDRDVVAAQLEYNLVVQVSPQRKLIHIWEGADRIFALIPG